MLNTSKLKAVLLMGPTATGKTDLGLKLANSYPIEIISVDSALIYKDMNIGTAKPSKDELSSVPHHLIDIITPLDKYSVAEFIQTTINLIEGINNRQKIPVLIGGTMMYYNGLINGMSILPASNLEVRTKIEQMALEKGLDKLYDELITVDPTAAAKINSHDKQRISRALEVYYLTGTTISQLQSANKINQASHIEFLPISIIPNQRNILHDRIENRFLKMIADGFIEEVEDLIVKYPTLNINHQSMRSVGYFQAFKYLSGELNFTQFQEQGIFATRQLAKRQITWLRSLNTTNIANDSLNFNYLYNNLIRLINSSLIDI